MIKSLSLKNWKSHKNTELEFSKKTNVIVGDMGSGKTSAMEAISYGLFGTYPSLRSRETTLDQIIMNKPQKESTSEVKVSFKVNGEKYTVKRTIERGKGTTESQLRKNGDLIEGPSTQKVTDTIEEILKIDYELFSKAVYAEQNQINHFLKIPRGKRRKEIDQLLELDKWEKARKNLTTVTNILKDRKKERENRTREKEGIEKIKELKKEIKQLNQEIKEKKKTRKKVKENLKKTKKEHREIKKKKKKHQELEKQINNLKNRIEYLEKDLEKLPKSENKEKTKQKLKNLKETKKKVKKKNKELNEIKTKIKTIKEEKKGKENKIKEKKEKISKIKGEEKIKEKLKNTKKELEKKQNKLKEKEIKTKQLKKEIKEEKNHLNKIKGEKAACPVCGADLTKGRKEKVIKDKKNRIQNLKTSKEETEKQIKTLEKKITNKKTRRKNLKKQKEKLEEKNRIKKNIEEKKEELKNKKQTIKRLKEKKSQIKIKEDEETLERKIKEAEEKLEYIKKAKEKKEKAKELEEKQKKKKELQFNEKKLEELYEELKSLEKKENVLKVEINKNEEIKDGKKENLKNLEQKKEKIEKAKKEAKYLESQIFSLNIFKNSLTKVQTHLRDKFTEETNAALNTVWKKIYPYGNYETIRLAVENEDYVLQFKTPKGEWLNVEGRASGGERSTAGLSLRIALALVLTGNLSWIILDEPTHNMDEKAIENLATALRTHLNDIIGQVFLITHEPKLKKASSGTFYKLSRDKEENEPTNVLKELAE